LGSHEIGDDEVADVDGVEGTEEKTDFHKIRNRRCILVIQ
jgi:hypothetical protein